jgi:hypothetical protein
LLRSNSSRRRTMTSMTKTRPMRSTLPLSDTKVEKMYCDVNEVESFGAEAPVPTGRLWTVLEHLGITTAPGTGSRKSHV